MISNPGGLYNLLSKYPPLIIYASYNVSIEHTLNFYDIKSNLLFVYLCSKDIRILTASENPLQQL